MLQLHIISLLFIVYFVCAGWVEPESEQPSYLEISALDQNTSEGLIVKGSNDNLTLSCALLRDGKQLPISSLNLQWSIPRQDVNRSSTWVGGGALWLSITQLTASDAGQYMCLELNNRVALAHVAVVVRAKGLYPYCSSALMFLCEKANSSVPGAKCVPYSFLCDGRPDCPNGRDETRDTCQTDDPCQGKLMCGDGRCIPREWCCDIRSGHHCLPHSCCPQIAIVERTGGGLRSGRGRENSKSQSLLQTTLYTVSVCLMIFLIAVTLLISAICKARLKRATHYSATLQGGQGDVPPEGSATPSPPSDWGYTRVPNSDAYNPQLIDSPRMVCPTYSEINNTNVCNVRQDSTQLPSYFEIASENQQINSINNVSSSPQARRPTDFGMSTLANAIFNARYRPIPQEVVTSSFNNNDISDSDSSCRSPGSHTFNVYTSPARRNNNFASPRRNNESFDSPLNRFGETPEAYLTRRSAEQRRLRRANALDRILDRFGLNAPYAVERESSQSQPSGNENVDTPLSPENENLNGRRQFVSSILGRLRNSFNRTPRVPETTEIQDTSTSSQVESRRRPDTPNVLELSLEEMDLARSGNGNDTYTLNGRTIHLLGASFEERPDLYSLGLQGLYIVDGIVENLNRFVSCPVLPPPYSEVANAAPSKVLGPPPPYVSRENLTTQGEASNVNAQASTSGNNVATTAISTVINVATCPNAINVDNDASCSSGDVVDNSVNSQNLILNSTSPNLEDGMNLSRDLSVDVFVSNDNCIRDSTPSIDVDAEVNLLKDILNGNGEGNDRNNRICPSNTLESSSNGGHLQIMSNRLKVEPVILDIEPNDVSNNNVVEQSSTERQSNQNDQNDNPSFVSESLVNRSLENTTGPTLKKSIFPPISLEFIDSDCITD